MTLKRLHANCEQVRDDRHPNKHVSSPHLCSACHETLVVPVSSLQDLMFASQLAKQSRASAEVLLEALRLLLPTLPEGELLAVTDALCPKREPPPASAEQEHSG